MSPRDLGGALNRMWEVLVPRRNVAGGPQAVVAGALPSKRYEDKEVADIQYMHIILIYSL